MSIDWDPRKARSNIKKHGVAFADAVSALEDDFALTVEDDYPNERRFITIGMNASGKLLVVVYTFSGEVIRIISARMATARERNDYEAG